MEKVKEIKDIGNPEEEFNRLTERFRLLHDRFIGIAMDYKHYISSEMNDHEIFALRDNVLYRLHSARFHFQLLLEHHVRIETRLQNLYKTKPEEFYQPGFEMYGIKDQSTKEIYSLFDSMVYHLCSIYDYLCRLINFSHGKEILVNPKWNVFFHVKNLKNHIYCSQELTPKLKKIDDEFVYPLIAHRSHLIHTQHDIGSFNLTFNLGGDKFGAKFYATKLFRENFPEIQIGNEAYELTVKYAALWLIDKTIKTTTEVLFELRDDMERNKKIPHGMFVLLGPDKNFIPSSTPRWGDRSIT